MTGAKYGTMKKRKYLGKTKSGMKVYTDTKIADLPYQIGHEVHLMQIAHTIKTTPQPETTYIGADGRHHSIYNS